MLAIVAVGYKRKKPLQRLLDCLNQADYCGDNDVRLIISLDRADNCEEMRALAEAFEWKHGYKEVILHPKRLGLREHFLFCGDLTQKYGSIIFLEDDVYALPEYYRFAKACVEKYENDERIAGASLYSLRYSETAHRPFTPLNDGTDVYFAQLMSWAPVYFPKQWKAFRDWYDLEPKPMDDISCLPDNVRQWKMTSFKKYHIKYTITHNKYFVYPQISFTTNFAEAGQHYAKDDDNLQVPLMIGNVEKYRLPSLEESKSLYDAYMEMTPECVKRHFTGLNDFDFSVDLYGNKRRENISTKYVITDKKSRKPIRMWGCKTVPQESNIFLDVPGETFTLSNVDDVIYFPRSITSLYGKVSYDIKGASPLKAFATDVRILIEELKTRVRRVK
ncbi:hypothetical protein [Enterococcus faecium]|uniref:hypothetical protein n=1 Tax=Enterococcus faecium TaxID=1352 RepID=UPI00102791B4|nr:hypothetical protein [Enterococcus faecium]MDO8004460.1 hypothetical protein [Enterococcus faecium]VFA64048.1 Kae1-associated kinase Bud32 [Enterococcus faecium]HAR8795684.1 hypothetical protein [Enterococcus faecium]